MRTKTTMLLAMTAILATPVVAGGDEPREGGRERLELEVKILIDRLGGPDWQSREEATRRLVEIGEPALSILTEAIIDNPDPEMRARCRVAIGTILGFHEEAAETGPDGMVFHAYDVRDLTMILSDFFTHRSTPDPEEGSLMTTMAEEPREIEWTPSDIQLLIEEQVQPDFWMNADGASINVTPGGLVIVRATPPVHRDIARLLEAMRYQRSQMVQTEAMFLLIPEPFLRDLRKDGIHLDEEKRNRIETAVDDGTIEVVGAANILCYNTQRTGVHGGTLTRATLRFDCRPIVSSTGDTITMEIQADLLGVRGRPDDESEADYPNYQFASTVTVPNGESVLLCGAGAYLGSDTKSRVVLLVRSEIVEYGR